MSGTQPRAAVIAMVPMLQMACAGGRAAAGWAWTNVAASTAVAPAAAAAAAVRLRRARRNRVMIYLPTALSVLSAACTHGRPGLVQPVGRGPQRPVLPVWRQLASGKRQGMILAPPAGFALSRLCTVGRVRQPRQPGGNAVVPPLSADSLA